MLTERHDALDTRRPGGGCEPAKLRVVPIKYCGSARLDACEDFRFGIRDFFQRAEIFEVHGFNAGNNCHARAHERCQRSDLACVIHADLKNRVFRAGRTSCER